MRAHLRPFVAYFLMLVLPATAAAQCVQAVDFNTWTETGDVYGNWSILSSGAELQTNVNTNYPTLYVGPDTLINVKVTGSFRVNDNSDDDYVGFVFGFQETNGYTWGPNASSAMDHQYYLFDWKKNGQNYIGYVAQEGFSLNKVNGTWNYTFGSVFPSFWVHTNSTSFDVLQTQFSTSAGWVSYTDYDFELFYTPTRAVITIDQDTIFDESGCFEPGLFGFYNYSQTGTRYWDFNYELYVDFAMSSVDICLGDTAEFYLIDTGSCSSANTFTTLDTFYWDLGDGTLTSDTNPTHVYDSAASYNIYLIATDVNGCTDTAARVINVYNVPNATIGFENTCLGTPMALADSTYMPFGSMAGWSWDFGDGNTDTLQHPVHLYAQSGNYTVTLVATNAGGCSDSTDTVVSVYAPPTPHFDFVENCDGEPLSFSDTSTVNTWPLASVEWDFESDGIIDNQGFDVTNVFGNYGSYAVEMFVYDSAGCVDSLTQNVLVFAMPAANFEVPGACLHDPSNLADSSTVANGTINTWHWDFGDGSTATTQHLQHTFATAGTHQVQLAVASPLGCADTVTKNVTVYFLPEAHFEPAGTCDNLSAEFLNLSTTQSGILTAYEWQFGDGNSSTQATTINNYSAPGYYEVTLWVESNFGCTDTAVRHQRIYPAPTAAFGWQGNVCEGDAMQVHDQSQVTQITPGGDQIISWQWLLNRDTFSTQQHPILQTLVAKTMRLDLYVTTNHGCVDSTFNMPSVHSIPEADFTVEPACQFDSSLFLDLSRVDNAIIDEWLWSTGDGNTYASRTFGHPYNISGEMPVTLDVWSQYGCHSQHRDTILIHARPTASLAAKPEAGCSPLHSNLVNLSMGNGYTFSSRWSLDGKTIARTTDAMAVITNDTLAPEEHQLALVVTSSAGCVSLPVHTTLTALPSPKAQFTMRDAEIEMIFPLVDFTNLSQHSSAWQWHFGDGTTSEDFSPSHTYEQSGLLEPLLIATNEWGCTDSASAALKINPLTTLYVPAAFTPNGDGINDRWYVQGFNENKPFRMQVFNRWGELLFTSTIIGDVWDGTLQTNGTLAPIGTYAYQITYYTSDDEYREVSGHFSLLR